MAQGRLELRHRTADGILSASLKVCLSIKTVLIFILLVSFAYELLLKRYAGFTNGKSTFHLSVQDGQDESADTSSLAKSLRLSFSSLIDEVANSALDQTQIPPEQVDEHEPKPFEDSQIKQGTELVEQVEQVDGDVKSEVEEVDGLKELVEEEETELPSLKIKYVGNGSRIGEATQTEEDEFQALTFTKALRRGMQRDREVNRGRERTIDSSATLLLLVVILLFFLLLVFLVLSFNQSIIIAVIGHSVASAYMGKPVRVTRALSSGMKVGLLRLMWLGVIYEMVRELQSLTLSLLLPGDIEGVDSLVLRLSTMPFAFLAPFRDEKVLHLGISRQVGVYLLTDYVFQSLLVTVFIVACWVTIFERNYKGLLAFRRSWSLIRSMPWLVICLRLVESLVAGRSFNWLLEKAFGYHTAVIVISVAEIYMLVTWLVFYFSARSKVEPRFSHRDLEDFLDTVRFAR